MQFFLKRVVSHFSTLPKCFTLANFVTSTHHTQMLMWHCWLQYKTNTAKFACMFTHPDYSTGVKPLRPNLSLSLFLSVHFMQLSHPPNLGWSPSFWSIHCHPSHHPLMTPYSRVIYTTPITLRQLPGTGYGGIYCMDETGTHLNCNCGVSRM